jgi:hypothetical protein
MSIGPNTRDAHSPRLLLLLISLSIVGIVLIACSRLFKLEMFHVGEILRDLGVAFCISVVVAVIIEVRLSRDTFLRGLDAIMERIVPDDVWEDFRQHVITQPIMREELCVTMAMVTPEYGQGVSTTSLKYTIVGLQNALRTYVEHAIDGHRTPRKPCNRYTRARIGNHEYLNHAELVSAKLLSADGLKLKLPVHLCRYGEKVPVEVEFKEAINCPDTIAWWMSRATRNLTITIEDLPESWSADVKTFHPAPNQLAPAGSNKWIFTGVMLPGQGVEIQIRRRSTPTRQEAVRKFQDDSSPIIPTSPVSLGPSAGWESFRGGVDLHAFREAGYLKSLALQLRERSDIELFLRNRLLELPDDTRGQDWVINLETTLKELSACLELHYVHGCGVLDPGTKCHKCDLQGTIVHGVLDIDGQSPTDYNDSYVSWCTNCLWAWHYYWVDYWGRGAAPFEYDTNTYKGFR